MMNNAQKQRSSQMSAQMDQRMMAALGQLGKWQYQIDPTCSYDAAQQDTATMASYRARMAQTSDIDRLHQMMRSSLSMPKREPTEREIAIAELKEFLGEVLWDMAPIV